MRLVLYLFSVFEASVKQASNSRQKSTITFQINVEELRRDHDSILFSMLEMYKE